MLPLRCKTVEAVGLRVFYRQAADLQAPKLLLLGGFPSSFHQFRNLILALADPFHVLSFPYPGCGSTDRPDPAQLDYTFDHIAEVIDALGAIHFTGSMGLYRQDYGGAIENRLIAMHPNWLLWQVIQNANSNEEGFTRSVGRPPACAVSRSQCGDQGAAPGLSGTRHRQGDLHHGPRQSRRHQPGHLEHAPVLSDPGLLRQGRPASNGPRALRNGRLCST